MCALDGHLDSTRLTTWRGNCRVNKLCCIARITEIRRGKNAKLPASKDKNKTAANMAHASLTVPQSGVLCDSSIKRQYSCIQQLISLRAAKSVICSAVSALDTAPSMNGASTDSFIRPHLRKLAAYTPIEPFEVLSQRLGRAPADIIKLDANENPYGPPREVLEALGQMPFPNIYPDPETRRLRSALAEMNDVPIEHLLVGCGADELIDLLMRCVLDPGDTIVDCPPTFTMYAFDAAVNGASVITVPRLDGFRIDVPAIEKAVREHQPKILFMTSPNNPDGSMIAEADLLAMLALPVLVVLDEAYIEFSEEPTRMRWVMERPNLVVLRTFSKSAGLAGLRVGYGAFPAGMIDYLWRAKQPYNVSVAAETAACAALTNPSYLQEVRDKLVTERERLFGLLQGVSFLEPYPSSANFILCKVVSGQDAKAVKDVLAAEHGIMVRHYAKAELSGFIRVSVGRPEHTNALMAALRSLEQPAVLAVEKE